MNCIVYIATKMTGRDRQEMIERANLVYLTLKKYGLNPISPVIEEGIKNEHGILIQTSAEQLKQFWNRDKYIIRNLAHVILLDEAYRKSTGMEREYGYARYCLWKPVVTVGINGFTVASFEDDYVAVDINEAAILIQKLWGTRLKRVKWRFLMLCRSLPKWIVGQILAWR